jgi:PAS domain S-box-containing protein
MHLMSGMAALRSRIKQFGIQQRILAVLVGVLLLTTALEAGFASYYTNRQNEQAAFGELSNQLFAWRNALQATTRQLIDEALATMGDAAVLNQLAELLTLEFNVNDPARTQFNGEMARALAYRKTVSLNRLQLALRTGGFSSIAVYTRGKLSHYVSTSAAGMMVTRPNAGQVWVTAAVDAHGNLPFQSWPAWSEHPVPTLEGVPVSPALRPRVDFVFPQVQQTMIEIAVPIQGLIDDSMTDADRNPMVRFFSELTIAGTTPGSSNDTLGNSPPGESPQIVTTVVFRKLIDRTGLETRARETGHAPTLLSPDGTHRQQLTNLELIPPDLLVRAQAGMSTSPPRVFQRTVTVGQNSFYVAVLPWQFENRPRLILSLAATRDSTLQNIRQTVVAISLVAGVILLLSVAVGTWWVRKFVHPIVDLTSAVHDITSGARPGSGIQPGIHPAGYQALTTQRTIDIEAPYEVGELARAFDAMITRLARQEADLLSSNANMTAVLRRMSAILDNIPDLAWVKDIEGRYIAANSVLARTFGICDPDAMIGKTDFDFSPREIAQNYQKADEEIIASGERKRLEELCWRGDGTTFWVETIKTPLRDPEGRIIGTVGIARDVTERMQVEREREARQVAEAANRAKSEFLANMSHELRTPLNAILGYAQILRHSRNLDARQTAGLNVIQQSGEHLLTLINDILDSAKIDAGKQELNPSDIWLRRFLRGICEIVRLKAEAKSLLFVCDLPAGLPDVVRADERRLRQVLLNLLANAVKFTDHGQVTLEVVFLPPSRLTFKVHDTGIGIAEQDIDSIFRPFAQVGEAQRRLGGTGLGLLISRQFVRLMGGDIEVQSRLGGGSTFEFSLEVPVISGLAREAPVRRITGYVGPRRTVLVVDDIAENRAVMRDLLEELDLVVVEAVNGRQALASVESQRFDLLLMDIFLPEMDGLEVIRRLRRRPELTDLPVIAVSASASNSDARSCLDAGANAFLPKPVDERALLEQIGKLLRIEWIRESPLTDAAARAPGQPFVIPPREEMKVLHDMALQGSMRDIAGRAAYVAALDERYRPFADQLLSLASQFQSEAILTLVERHLREEKTA